MGRKYPAVGANEWVQPVRRGYRMRCCDCGLVHTMNFRIRDGRVQLQADRDVRATASVRAAATRKKRRTTS